MDKNLKIIFVVFLISLPFWWSMSFLKNHLEDFFYGQISKPFEEMAFVKIPDKPELEIEAKSAFSIRISQNNREKTFFIKNPEEVLPIASLTKLMTALVVLEDPKAYYFQRRISISPKAAAQIDIPIYGNLIAGERKTVGELLDLILIYSSNDAAWALAEQVGVENFVEKMNQKAEELGLKNTNFVNPTGLDPENLYYHLPTQENFNRSTAKDLVKLTQYILFNHPSIFEISLKTGPYLIRNGISDLTLPPSHQKLGGRINLLGGKTGYTPEAGGCLLSVFENEKGSLFYNVILGTPREARIKEMLKLIDRLIL